jgi:hypothetical protein
MLAPKEHNNTKKIFLAHKVQYVIWDIVYGKK